MKIKMERVNETVHFKCENIHGNEVHVDGDPDIGGENKGVRPTELVLMGAASCSAIDIVTLLKKMRQPLEDIKMEVEGTKRDEVPRVFIGIHMHYVLKGDLNPKKVEKAINLSVTKYCTVSKMLEKTAEITSSYEIIN